MLSRLGNKDGDVIDPISRAKAGHQLLYPHHLVVAVGAAAGRGGTSPIALLADRSAVRVEDGFLRYLSVVHNCRAAVATNGFAGSSIVIHSINDVVFLGMILAKVLVSLFVVVGVLIQTIHHRVVRRGIHVDLGGVG